MLGYNRFTGNYNREGRGNLFPTTINLPYIALEQNGDIDKFFVILSPDWAEKVNCGICSYENNLVVTFGTLLNNCLLENKFKELLVENNIDLNIEGNEVNVIL